MSIRTKAHILAFLAVILAALLFLSLCSLNDWKVAYDARTKEVAKLSEDLTRCEAVRDDLKVKTQLVVDERDLAVDLLDECATERELYMGEVEHLTACLESTVLYFEPPLISVAELEDWLAVDNLDRHVFQAGEFDCRHFAQTLVWRLNATGISAFCVLAEFDDGTDEGHVLVTVPTTQGMVFVEPQSDGITAWPMWGDEYASVVVILSDLPEHIMYSD